VAAPDPMLPGLAPEADVPSKDRFDERTAATSPDARADGVAGLIAEVGAGFRAAGACDTTGIEVAVANSEGQCCYAPYTQTSVSTVVSGGDGGAGAAEKSAGRVDEVDLAEIGHRAFQKARTSQAPRDVEPGRYEVVLEPLAVSTMAAFLAYLAFGGRSLAEGRSALSGKEGERVAAASVTIVDDAL